MDLRPVLIVIAFCLAGCADDAAAKKDPVQSDGPSGEACLNPGMTMTGCLCDTGQKGSRRCTQDGVWTQCSCPDVLDPGVCPDGMLYTCPPCDDAPDGGERIRECIDGGVDCSC